MNTDDEATHQNRSDFPAALQGRWICEDDPFCELVIAGDALTWGGEPTDYRETTVTVAPDGGIFVMVMLAEPRERDDTLRIRTRPAGRIDVSQGHMIAELRSADLTSTDFDPYARILERKQHLRDQSSEAEVSRRRQADFPGPLQGRWVDEEDPSFDVSIQGDGITWNGRPMDYLDKIWTFAADGSVWVEVTVPDQTDEGDAIKLLADSEGGLSAFNDHFVANLVRPEPSSKDQFAGKGAPEVGHISSRPDLMMDRWQEADFPDFLQGRWVYEQNPEREVHVLGAQIIWAGKPWPYLDKTLKSDRNGLYLLELGLPAHPQKDEALNLMRTPGDELYVFNRYAAASLLRPRPDTLERPRKDLS